MTPSPPAPASPDAGPKGPASRFSGREDLGGRRVALVHDWLNGMRGGEKVLEHVCAIFPDADLYTLIYEPDRVSDVIRRMNVFESGFADLPGARRHYRKLLPLMPREIESIPTEDYDLVLSTSHCVAKGARPPRRGPHLAYVFSPMRYVWDHYEDYVSGRPLERLALGAVRRRLQDWDRSTAQRLHAIAADSRHIARKIQKFWGRRAEAILPPADLEAFTPSGEEPRGYLLVVAAQVPYKKVDRAIDAARLTARRLVIVGDGPERKRLEAHAAGALVEFRGWLPERELREAYRHCDALLYPGVEDYGITALEAQACGRPVIALRQGGATETILAGRTGLFFDEPGAEALAEAIDSFDSGMFDPHEIRRHAETFSPSRFRRELAEWIAREMQVF